MLMMAVQDAHFGSALIVAIRKKLPYLPAMKQREET
jgi:hypothetical protein